MVKVFSEIGSNKISKQHKKIIRWMEQSSEFKDAVVFLEFRFHGFGSRDVDILVLLNDRIHLIELKGHTFTDIPMNGKWQFYDHKTHQKKEYPPEGRRNQETPYQQAINTANSLKKWIQNHCNELTGELADSINIQNFLKSEEEFDIFPIVFINDNKFLDKKKIQEHPWCKICVGTAQLKKKLKRKYDTSVKLDSIFF